MSQVSASSTLDMSMTWAAFEVVVSFLIFYYLFQFLMKFVFGLVNSVQNWNLHPGEIADMSCKTVSAIFAVGAAAAGVHLMGLEKPTLGSHHMVGKLFYCMINNLMTINYDSKFQK